MQTVIDTVDSLWKVVVVGLAFGAGLPAIFALGLRALGAEDGSGGRPLLGSLLGYACFTIVAAAVVAGIVFIVVGSS